MRSFILALALVLFINTPTTAAEEQSVAEEILQILYDTGQIDKPTFDRLLEKACAEEAKRAGKTMASQTPTEVPKKKKGEDLRVFWDKGLKAETADKSTSFKSTGRVFIDFAGTAADDQLVEAFGSEVEGYGSTFRSARIGLAGKLYNRFTIKLDYDFAGGDVDFADVYAGVLNLGPIDEIRVGHQKYALSVSEQTSLRFTPFMERSSANEAFYSSPFGGIRDVGLRSMSTFLDKRLGVGLAYYIDADGFGNGRQTGDASHFMARVHGTPWKGEDGLAHLGIGWRRTLADDSIEGGDPVDPVRFRARPTARFTTQRLVDTPSLAADSVDLLNFEAAATYGPVTLQGEYFRSMVDLDEDVYGDDGAVFDGGYIWASWLLTGERRKYNAKNGGWGRIVPKSNLFDGGLGAFELSGRYAFVDLNDTDDGLDIRGGEQRDFTLGLNWYLHTNFRWMFNYAYVNVEDRNSRGVLLDDVDFHALQTRFQFDF
jgi:phosphate-selective porin OprO/OprP